MTLPNRYILIFCSLWSLVASFSSPPPPCRPLPLRNWQSQVRAAVAQRSSVVALSATTAVVPDKYLRWKKDGDKWSMQTAVTTFQQGNKTVELHAQLHFGDDAYFDFYNSPDFENSIDHVHYELLVDDELLKYQNGNWKLQEPIMASQNDQNLAKSYGWKCQASKIDYTNPKWIHADLTRQEFLKLAAEKESSSSGGGRGGSSSSSNGSVPLWKVASGPESSSTAAEAVSALLVGPPTLSYSTQFLKRRLFTNLFLPGDSFANSLRALLWLTVPAPELSIILLDWASLLKGGANPNALSKVAVPILSSLVKFDIAQIRRFLFGQVLVSSAVTGPPKTNSNNNNKSSAWSILVTKRNDHALEVLQNTLSESTGPTSTALLYGSSHCPDLHAKLSSLGFRPTKTTWRTAWSVEEKEQEMILPALFVFLGGYLVVGALDWVEMLGDFSQAWLDNEYLDSGVVAGLYLIRHVLLYLGLSKFLVDWTNKND